MGCCLIHSGLWGRRYSSEDLITLSGTVSSVESEKSGLKLRFADSEQCYLLSDRLIEFAHPNVEAIRAGNSLSVTIDKSDQHSYQKYAQLLSTASLVLIAT